MKSRIYLLALATCLVTFGVGCDYIQRRINRPSQTVKEFYKHVEAGNIDGAEKQVVKNFVQFDDMKGFREYVANNSDAIRRAGGIDSLSVDKESIEGEIGTVEITVKTRRNPEVQVRFKLGWESEENAWKILGWIFPNQR